MVSELDEATKKMERATTELSEERARSYQLELLEFAKENNTIVCLGTGTGKTFISVLLIKHFEHEIVGPWAPDSAAKRTIFLAPSVPLVEQQCSVLSQHLSVRVRMFVGSMDVDRWNEDHWEQHLRTTEVLVMTPEVFRQATHSAFIPMKRINLIVFDECHHATGNTPYRMIMQMFKDLEVQDRPRILGLTASLVNTAGSPEAASKKIRELEATLFSTAKTASQCEDSFGTEPEEVIASFSDLKQPPMSFDGDLLSSFSQSTDGKLFMKVIKHIHEVYGICGRFCAKKLLEFRQRELQKALDSPECSDTFRKNAPRKFEIYRQLHECFGEDPSPFAVTPKLHRLLGLLKDSLDDTDTLCGMVFVEQRLVAYILHLWMHEVAKTEEWSFVRSAFVTGHNQSPIYSMVGDVDTLHMTVRAQKKVVKDYRSGVYNLLFATSVMEEGMDVPACNIVIRFDLPLDIRSYIQCKGRARAKPSRFVVLTREYELPRTRRALEGYQETQIMIRQCCEEQREAPTLDESQKILDADPDLPPYVHGDAMILPQNAISLVNWYAQSYMRWSYPNVFPKYGVRQLGEDQFSASLSLPICCPLRKPIWCDTPLGTAYKAKIAVSMKVLKMLHACGELDDHLVPRRRIENLYRLKITSRDADIDDALSERLTKPLGKEVYKKRYVFERKTIDQLKVAEEGVDCDEQDTYHLYVLKTEVHEWAQRPAGGKNYKLFDPSSEAVTPAVLVRDPIPGFQSFPIFPIYTRSGVEHVDIIYAGTVSLDQDMKRKCARFNRYVFDVVLEIADSSVRACMNFASPTVVLVKMSSRGSYDLCSDVMAEVGPSRHPEQLPPAAAENLYDNVVVELLYHINENMPDHCKSSHVKTPWSRYAKFYVTSSDARGEDGSPLTPDTRGMFDFSESMSLGEYVMRKKIRGGQPAFIKQQKVLEVEHVHERLEMTRPRPDHVHNESGDPQQLISRPAEVTYLLPQFVALHALQASIWRKLTSVPSILHRMNRILVSDLFRKTIIQDTGLGGKERGGRWRYASRQRRTFTTWTDCLTFMGGKSGDRNLKEEVSHPDGVSDGGREISEMDTQDTPLEEGGVAVEADYSPCDIMGALSTKSTDECSDFERLELLGDSFLNLATAFSLYDHHPKATIGELCTLQQYSVQNKNLLRKAFQRGLTDLVDTVRFSARVNFLPPGYKQIPGIESLYDPGLLKLLFESYGFDGENETYLKDLRYAADLENTLRALAELPKGDRLEMLLKTKINDEEIPQREALPIRSHQEYKSKVGGDVVEALIGLHLQTFGPSGALKFLQWMDLDFGRPKATSFVDSYHLDFNDCITVLVTDRERYGHVVNFVEEKIAYRFRRRELVLEAVTHHSCREHSITRDNAKIAFIGAAVMDYLLTVHIDHLNKEFGPGELTDLRSALTNNQVAAYTIVSKNLHTVFLYTNSKLFKAIRKYVDNYEQIGLRLNTVLGDWETDESEEAEVPQPLGRLLPALIGAVFIDSGKDFSTAWSVLEWMMSPVLETLKTDIPLSPIRELLRDYPNTSFKSTPILDGEDKDKLEITMRLRLRNGDEEVFKQVAETKRMGKTILAKRFLRQREKDRRRAEILQCRKENVVEESVNSLGEALLHAEMVKSKFYKK